MHQLMRFVTTALFVFCAFTSSALATPEPRDFDQLTEDNIKDIDYIITSLGTKSLVAIGFARPKLCKAGERINTVHPIRYILHILSDKRLTHNLCAIRETRMLWKGFLHGKSGDDGFLDSLRQESEAGGIYSEHIHALSKKIGVNYEYIQMLSDTNQWERIMQLITKHAIGTVKFIPYDDV